MKTTTTAKTTPMIKPVLSLLLDEGGGAGVGEAVPIWATTVVAVA